MDLRLPRTVYVGALRLGAIAFAAACVAATVAFAITFNVLGRIEAERAEGRLALYRSGLEAELGRVVHLPHILSQDPLMRAVLLGADPAPVNRRLADYARRAEVDALYLIDRNGTTLAASNAGEPGSFVGQNYAFRPYFRQALGGGTGTFFGVGATTNRPGHFIAEPITDATGRVIGVMTVKLDLSRLERDWTQANEAVRVLNADGITILTSRDDWRYRPSGPVSDTARTRITQTRQFGDSPALLAPLPLPADMLIQTMTTMPWTVGYSPTTGEAKLWALIAAGAMAASVGLASLIWTGRRALQIAADLRRSEVKEAVLRRMNNRLTQEKADREAAETLLRATQVELARAGRLAVLGRVAASVCHELGQPIAAMRNYLHADALDAGQTDPREQTMNQRIGGLVERLDGITRQLRFFARAQAPTIEPVPIEEVLRYAVEILQTEIERVDATVLLPDVGASVRGDRGRLEQVAVNLIRNGLDAVEGCAKRVVSIDIAAQDDDVVLTIEDSGPGLSVSLEEASEPFFTTRASGEGTGLGLAITAEIVREHGGTIRSVPTRLGGAGFAVLLPRA
jgi:two-component system C4-dicarboxylate transport sensor histidine kinase DctB